MFKKLPFGITCSSFILAAVIKIHLQQYPSETNNILQNTYVDNIILTTLDQKQILKHYQAFKLIFNNAKINIRQFSNKQN